MSIECVHSRLAEPQQARVAFAAHDRFLLWMPDGSEVQASISGRLRYDSEIWPATGDWVIVREGGVIEEILPRRTTLSRKVPGKAIEEQVLAANIDRLFLVTGLDRDYNPRRLERYLVLAAESGADPVVVLNKADLHEDVTPFVEATRALTGAPVHAVSALLGDGLDALTSMLSAGDTAALVGSSGAGKSTLVNALLGGERQKTGPVREFDQKGRHTTTHREMFRMPGGWTLIDMPGLRELQLWADPETLGGAFAEIEALAEQCHFRDCRHQGEPGCAVAAANLSEDRLASHAKLTRELAHFERQRDAHAARAEKQRWKSIHKAMRNFDKRK